MKYKFQLSDFPNSSFEIETSIWTGKSKLFKDNVQVEQSKEKGKPFIIPNGTEEPIKAFPKPSLPDVVPTLEINGIKNQIVPKLKWFQYVLGGSSCFISFCRWCNWWRNRCCWFDDKFYDFQTRKLRIFKIFKSYWSCNSDFYALLYFLQQSFLH